MEFYRILKLNILKTLLFPIKKLLRIKEEKVLIKGNECFAQEGEDIVLKRFYEGKLKGFFIDVGAHHPIRFSNTYLFYQKGWRGINIDAMPGSMEIFNKLRPDDLNLEIPISSQSKILVYYVFNESALNTFSIEEAQKKDGLNGYKIVDRKVLKTRSLASVLDEYLPYEQFIDFLSVDVEGLDCDVLCSNNWEKYRPTFVLVEELGGSSIEKIINESKIYKFLKDNNYELVSKTVNTLFFKKLF